MDDHIFTPAPLSDPLYYLHNMRGVIRWCLEYHYDLLTEQEITTLHKFLKLDTQPQALLVRLIMRKGPLFRTDKLQYSEIPLLDQALVNLQTHQFINTQPFLALTELVPLCRKEECKALAEPHLPEKPDKRLNKGQLITLLLHNVPEDERRAIGGWWDSAPFQVIEFTQTELFERLRLMFFGNLHQTWSAFVLEELGHQRYEKVPFSQSARAFQSRSEVDHYLTLRALSEQLESEGQPAQLAPQIPQPVESAWLNTKRAQLIFSVGHTAERQGDTSLALQLYRSINLEDALIRQYRLLEKQTSSHEVFDSVSNTLQQNLRPETRLLLKRVQKRSARKSGNPMPAEAQRTPLKTEHLLLKKIAGVSVEQAVVDHLKETGFEAFYVENRLFTGLFALLFWPALFKPIRGAFFNPFQSGPADLYRPEFLQLRKAEIEDSFNSLHDNSYRSLIRERYSEKKGISCSLLHWATLEPELIEPVLDTIPAEHLKVIFQHLLLDLKNHRRGFPDLIHFNQKTNEYCLIEVKGPGDRLQEHQRLWLEHFTQNNIPARVCYVEWDQAPGSTKP